MEFVIEYWLALSCLVAAALCFAALAAHRLRRNVWPWHYGFPGLVLASYGVGAFDFMPWWVGASIALAAFAAFVTLLAFVILNGFWFAPAGYGLTALFFFGLGAATGYYVAEGLHI